MSTRNSMASLAAALFGLLICPLAWAQEVPAEQSPEQIEDLTPQATAPEETPPQSIVPEAIIPEATVPAETSPQSAASEEPETPARARAARGGQRSGQWRDAAIAAQLRIDSEVHARICEFAAQHAESEEVKQFAQNVDRGYSEMIAKFSQPQQGAERGFDVSSTLRQIAQRLEERSGEVRQVLGFREPVPLEQSETERNAAGQRRQELQQTLAKQRDAIREARRNVREQRRVREAREDREEAEETDVPVSEDGGEAAAAANETSGEDAATSEAAGEDATAVRGARGEARRTTRGENASAAREAGRAARGENTAAAREARRGAQNDVALRQAQRELREARRELRTLRQTASTADGVAGRDLRQLWARVPEILNVVAKTADEMGWNKTQGSFLEYERNVAERLADTITKEWKQKTGKEFEKAYLNYEVLSHLKTLDRMEVAKRYCSPEMCAALDEASTLAQDRLRQARELMQKISQAGG